MHACRIVWVTTRWLKYIHCWTKRSVRGDIDMCFHTTWSILQYYICVNKSYMYIDICYVIQFASKKWRNMNVWLYYDLILYWKYALCNAEVCTGLNPMLLVIKGSLLSNHNLNISQFHIMFWFYFWIRYIF